MLNGLKSILTWYAAPLQIESDNTFLVNELKKKGSSKSLIAGIVQDIKNTMSSMSDIYISKVNRSGNKVGPVWRRLLSKIVIKRIL
jgi:hypothetical protein